MELGEEDVHDGHLEVVSDEEHLCEMHVMLEFPCIVANICKLRLH